MQKLIKYVWNGSKIVRINPVVAIGSYVVETAIFLAWAPVVEDFLVKHWDRNFAINDVAEARKSLWDTIVYQRSNKKLKRRLKYLLMQWMSIEGQSFIVRI